MILTSDNYNPAGRILLLTLLLAAMPLITMAQIVKEKRIAKSYTVTKNTEVAFDNSFGLLHIETWDRNQVEVEIEIEVDMKNENHAQKAMEKIEVKIDDSNPASRLAFTTEVKSLNNSKGEGFSIDYRIKMPANLKLEVANKFGDLVIGDYQGEIKLRSEYGNMRAGSLNADSEVIVKFGDGEVTYMKEGELTVGYSDFDADKVGNINADLSFSDVTIGEAGEVSLKIKYGELSFDNINVLTGKGSFTSIEIDELSDRLEIEGSYISDLRVDLVRKGFSLIEVDNAFGETQLGFEPGAGASIEADFSFGELKYDRDLGIKFSHLETDDFKKKSYRGTFGGGKGRVKLSGNYASGTLRSE
ncbi:hypothetical protein AB9P05_03070 [Roseivirga sp. BDSF3-8]|uniref:hypothetical protein n=1 Tax=Roseivirga sp. BDSF3-8 TaxID=3241598 RepID=UPI003531AD7A